MRIPWGREEAKAQDIEWNEHLIFVSIAVLVLGGLLWTIHDRYLPMVSDGWIQYYGMLTERGLLPYKEFYYFTQPVPLFIVQVLAHMGNPLLLYRYEGMLERISILLALYYLVSREFSPQASFLGSVAAIFLFQGYTQDLLYTYVQTTLLLLLLALICLYRSRSSERPWLYLLAVGILSSLAFFTKQSTGAFIVLFFGFVLVILPPRRVALARLALFATGGLLTTAPIAYWMIRDRILISYLDQVFGGGTSAKGNLITILFGFWTRPDAVWYLSLFSVGTALLFYLKKTGKVHIELLPQSKDEARKLNGVLLVSFGIYVLLACFSIVYSRIGPSAAGQLYFVFWTYLTFFGVLLALLWIARNRWLKKQLPFSELLAVLAGASFVWMYSCALSYAVDMGSTLPASALLVAFLFDRVLVNKRRRQIPLIALVCFLVFFNVTRKLGMPYSWHGWIEFGHAENARSIVPALQGFNLSEQDVRIYDRVYSDIVNNTKPNESVYTYPSIVLLNYVAGRVQPTFTAVDYIDVTPDYQALQSAKLIRDHPPKMIVLLSFPDETERWLEAAFRAGKPAAQRQLEATIQEVVQKYHYRTLDTFTTPGWEYLLTVYLRPD